MVSAATVATFRKYSGKAIFLVCPVIIDKPIQVLIDLPAARGWYPLAGLMWLAHRHLNTMLDRLILEAGLMVQARRPFLSSTPVARLALVDIAKVFLSSAVVSSPSRWFSTVWAHDRNADFGKSGALFEFCGGRMASPAEAAEVADGEKSAFLPGAVRWVLLG